MSATKHNNSINQVLAAMGIQDLERTLPSKKNRSDYSVAAGKKGFRK
jgi:hypothetical protein